MKWIPDPERKLEIEISDSDRIEFKLRNIMVPPGRKISLRKDYDPRFSGEYKDKKAAQARVQKNVERLQSLQDKLWAQDSYAVLIIFQALDAAGKDGALKYVMSGVNPQGVQVTSFKAPSSEELDHDYLWRASKALPQRGMIGIFNRSYYEECLVVRVHPQILAAQKLPDEARAADVFERRFEQINNFERYLVENGTIIFKFFLNVSKDEQRQRFLARIDEADKNWKFATADYKERAHWDQYQDAYQDVFNNTSTSWAPWFVIPADRKWFTRLAISEVLCDTLEHLDLRYPKVGKERKQELLEIKKALDAEG